MCYCEMGERKISDGANRWLVASRVSAGGPVAKFCPFQKLCAFIEHLLLLPVKCTNHAGDNACPQPLAAVGLIMRAAGLMVVFYG